jgi:hypothetical protein
MMMMICKSIVPEPIKLNFKKGHLLNVIDTKGGPRGIREKNLQRVDPVRYIQPTKTLNLQCISEDYKKMMQV